MYRIYGSEAALKTIEEGLLENSQYYNLLILKAQILTYSYLNLHTIEIRKKLDEALNIVNYCENLFNKKYADLLSWKEISINSIEDLSRYFNEKNELDNLRININNLISTVSIFGEIRNIQSKNIEIENRLFKERIRLIEILGLFVAIFAFIFSTVQLSINYKIEEAFTLISGLAMLLILFLLILHLVINPEEKTKALIFIIIFLLLLLLYLFQFYQI